MSNQVARVRTRTRPVQQPQPRRRPSDGLGAKAADLTTAAPENAGEDAGNGLISQLRAKRAEVERYLRTVGARRRRLVTVTIVAAAIATMLTAPAALGGKPLADWLTETFELSSPSWRILCALAAVCSLTAAVATQLHTSKNYEEHIARAEASKATLEMLEVAITSNHLSQHEVTTQYLKIIENTSFIEAAR
jgi:MFS family permease